MRRNKMLVIVALALPLITGLNQDVTKEQECETYVPGTTTVPGTTAVPGTTTVPGTTAVPSSTSLLTDPTNGTSPVPTPLRLSDLKIAGYILLPVASLFIVVDGFLVGLVCKNWKRIKDSPYCNSCLFCLLLTSADLALALLLGLPIGIRLSFEEELRKNKSLVYYTQNIGFILYEYLFYLRMLIIVALSADRCLQIVKPFRYMMLATKIRMKIVCGVILVLPLLRMAPVFLSLPQHIQGYPCPEKRHALINCVYYTEPHDEFDGGRKISDHYNPLRCDLDTSIVSELVPGLQLQKAEVIIPGVISGISWLMILVSNLIILKLVVQMGSSGYYTVQQRAQMNKKLIQSCIVVMLVTFSFVFTNFPVTYVRINTYMHQENHDDNVNYQLEFYFILLSYSSLFFHPWLHVIRIRSIKELVIGIKNRVHTLSNATQSTRASAQTIQSGKSTRSGSNQLGCSSNKLRADKTTRQDRSPTLVQLRKQTNETLA